MITMDYETRSAADLLKEGGYVYSRDPSTSILCLAWVYDDEEEVHLWHPAFPGAYRGKKRLPDPVPEEGAEELGELLDRVLLGEDIEAHNVFFERSIWTNVCKWPELDPGQLHCSAAKAASFALPRKLEQACEALGLVEQKDMEGHKLMQRLSKPRKPRVAELRAIGMEKGDEALFTAIHGYVWNEDSWDLERLFDYCRQDVRAERCLSQNLRDLSPTERKVWLLDQDINWRGVHIDRPGAEKALALATEYKARADLEIADLTFGEVKGCTKRPSLSSWLAAENIDIPDTKGDTIDLWLERDIPEHVAGVLRVWKGANRTSTAKYVAMLRRVWDDDRVRDILRYWGASTGRWAGAGIQVQNFPRGGLENMEAAWDDILALSFDELAGRYPDVMELLAEALRGAICATPGHILRTADYASIEARVLFWIAGELRALQLLHEGKNIYKDMAGTILDFMGRPIADPQAITKKESVYQLGKQAILGLGYQMGGPKFQTTCAGYGIQVNEDFAKDVVDLYRSTYPAVKALWKAMEAAAILAVERGPRAAKPVECKNTKWAQRGRFLHCRLPGGRLLSYCDPKVVPSVTPWGDPCKKLRFMGVDTYTKKWSRQSTYGGKLVENVVQATSRDLMADSMLRCVDAGYPPVMTVHDEIVAEVPEGHGSQEEFEQIMATIPAWAEGCPVEAEGWAGRRYRK